MLLSAMTTPCLPMEPTSFARPTTAATGLGCTGFPMMRTSAPSFLIRRHHPPYTLLPATESYGPLIVELRGQQGMLVLTTCASLLLLSIPTLLLTCMPALRAECSGLSMAARHGQGPMPALRT